MRAGSLRIMVPFCGNALASSRASGPPGSGSPGPLSSRRTHGHKKGPRGWLRPKSREETPKEGIRVVPTDSQKCWHVFAAVSLRLRRIECRTSTTRMKSRAHGQACRDDVGVKLVPTWRGLEQEVRTGLFGSKSEVILPVHLRQMLAPSSISARSLGSEQSRESKPPGPNSHRCHQPDGRRWSADHHEVISKNRDATPADHLETGECP
jgi:hypothetical protein